MPTLVIRNVPNALHEKLKAAAAAHHRSMTQEAIHALSAMLEAPVAPEKPAVAASLAWLNSEVWPRLVADTRSADDVLGYDEHGLPG